MNDLTHHRGGQLTVGTPQSVIVQVPAVAQALSILPHVLANPNAVVQQAISLIDENCDSVTIRERVIIYLEE